MYDQHRCPESYKKNNQVPVCPLCNLPIPLRPGQTADNEVGRHIDSDCQSDPAKERRKVYTNKCSKKGCKVKELVPFNCGSCRQNFCIKHRHEKDHSCGGFEGSGRSVTAAGAAAASRATASTSSRTAHTSSSKPAAQPQLRQQTLTNMGLGRQLNEQRQARTGQGARVTASAVHNMQGSMTEEQALAQALAMSAAAAAPTQQAAPTSDEEAARRAQEEEDEALARALQQSEADARNRRATTANTGVVMG